jgi:phosphoribosylglycinamide formyltransferase-1
LELASNDRPLRLGILLSGRGSNFVAIAESIRAGRLKGVEIAVVVSNVAEAGGLEVARELGLPTAVFVVADYKRRWRDGFIDATASEQSPKKKGFLIPVYQKGDIRAEHETDVIACLREHRVDLICLAGYLRLLSEEFVAAFPNRILNIHPSLLPAFPGLEAQQQAFDYGVKMAGCTVHFADAQLDHGVIVLQRAIPVLETDDAHSLAGRILVEEHLAYTEAIARVASGEYEIRGRRFVKRNS